MHTSTELRRIGAWLAINDDRSQFAVTQLWKLRRQLPSLYALLVINMLAVSYTHQGLAPATLTTWAPLFFASLCLYRGVYWRMRFDTVFTNAESIGHMRRITALGTVMSLSIVTWALALDRYGGAFERGHIAFFIAITVIGCIFCLMHLPQAALLVSGSVLLPYMIYYATIGHPVFLAIACNLFLVALVMGQVLMNNFRGFVDLEMSKAALASEQAQTRLLSSENAVLANTDSLTGLPNRRAFFARLDTLIAEAAAREATFAIGIVDLDGFKPINDSMGHAVGDRVLVEIGRRLEGLAGRDASVARLGGDEFGILLAGALDEASVQSFGCRLCRELSRPFVIDGLHLAWGVSCGLAIQTQAADGAAMLYDRADYALYDAKANLRGGAVLFGDAHEIRLRDERAIESALTLADLQAEIEMHFQPIVELATGRAVGAEALARWTSPVLGAVPPNRFIEVAERTGLIRKLTPILLEKALASAATWAEPLDLSFNLSAHDIVSPDTMLGIVAAVARSGVDPARITFEITETAVMRDFDLARRHILVLRESGMKVALDDFGAGYSSLSCVHRLPLDKIKIDRSFVHGITTEMEGRKVVQTILDLCATLGLDCVVEGVETPAQASLIAQLGGRHAQGYLYGRPIPPADFARAFAAKGGRIAA